MYMCVYTLLKIQREFYTNSTARFQFHVAKGYHIGQDVSRPRWFLLSDWRFSCLTCYVDNTPSCSVLYVELTVLLPAKDDPRVSESAVVIANSNDKVEWNIPSLLKLPHLWFSSFRLASTCSQCVSPAHSSFEASFISVLPLHFQHPDGALSFTRGQLKSWRKPQLLQPGMLPPGNIVTRTGDVRLPSVVSSFIHSANIYWPSTVCQVPCLAWE